MTELQTTAIRQPILVWHKWPDLRCALMQLTAGCLHSNPEWCRTRNESPSLRSVSNNYYPSNNLEKYWIWWQCPSLRRTEPRYFGSIRPFMGDLMQSERPARFESCKKYCCKLPHFRFSLCMKLQWTKRQRNSVYSVLPFWLAEMSYSLWLDRFNYANSFI